MKRVVLAIFSVMLFMNVAMAESVKEIAVQEEVVKQETLNFEVIAKRGMSGEKITEVQNMLSKLGYFTSADGNFGQETEDAVKAFQGKLNIERDGIVTDDLYRLLKHYADKVVQTDAPAQYTRQLRMEATAYTTEDPGCGLYTARGTRLRKGLVAVDPRVIPLGTRLYIPGYGYALADDTGGAIIGNRIDLAYESRSEALQFGRRMITVYILD